MKTAIRLPAIALATLVLILFVSPVRAQKPTTILAYWSSDEIVKLIPGVSANVFGVNHSGITNNAANPLYLDGASTLDPNNQLSGLLHVDHILGVAVPGVAGYNPWWDVILVIYPSTGQLADFGFTSEAEILDARDAGDVVLVDTGIVLLCQVVSR